MKKIFIPLLLSSTCLLSSCMVGPHFNAPKVATGNAYTHTSLGTHTPAGNSQNPTQVFVYNEDISAVWWSLFKSPALNQLIQTGLYQNNDLAAACAALKQAEEILNAQIGSTYLPSINFQGAATRQRSNLAVTTTGNASLFTIYHAGFNVGYVFDFFGGARRTTEALLAQVDNQQYELQAARLTVSANIAATAINLAATKMQIATTQALIQAQSAQLDIINKQFQYGAVAIDAKLAQETLLAQTKATLPGLEKTYFNFYHALNVLIGANPGTPLPELNLNQLVLPKKLPVTLPSQLVRQRPDILAKEALLHAASAQIGVATANLFPQFNLSASFSSDATVPSQLFHSVTNLWAISGQVMQPIFQGGALFAKRREAIDAYQQAQAIYQQTVLLAFKNVADSLRAIQADAKLLAAAQAAANSAKRMLDITQKQYRLGAVSYLVILNAQQQYQQTRIALIQAQASRYLDTVMLYQALGGGWWNASQRRIS